MFILNENKKSLHANIIINKAMVSMNTHNLASSSGQSGEGQGFLIFGILDDVPYIYAIISFNHINDIYESDELIMNENDVSNIWHEAIVFLENLGFYLDDIDTVSVREDFRLFEVKEEENQKLSKTFYNDEESDAIIDFLASY